MKKKFFRLSATGLLFFSGVMEIGWRFFNMVVCCKRGGRKKERKKWFELSHIRDNHPRNGYAKMYGMNDITLMRLGGWKKHEMIQRYVALRAEFMADELNKVK